MYGPWPRCSVCHCILPGHWDECALDPDREQSRVMRAETDRLARVLDGVADDALDAPTNSRPVRLTLPRWHTVIAFNGALGRRMRGVYIRESIALGTAL